MKWNNFDILIQEGIHSFSRSQRLDGEILIPKYGNGGIHLVKKEQIFRRGIEVLHITRQILKQRCIEL